MNDSDNAAPPRLAIALGILGVLVSFFGLYYIYLCGEGVRDVVRAIRIAPEALTVVLLHISRFIGNFWSLLVAVMLAFYFLWVIKSKRRMVVFSAVYACALGFALPFAQVVSTNQKLIVQEKLRSVR